MIYVILFNSQNIHGWSNHVMGKELKGTFEAMRFWSVHYQLAANWTWPQILWLLWAKYLCHLRQVLWALQGLGFLCTIKWRNSAIGWLWFLYYFNVIIILVHTAVTKYYWLKVLNNRYVFLIVQDWKVLDQGTTMVQFW